MFPEDLVGVAVRRHGVRLSLRRARLLGTRQLLEPVAASRSARLDQIENRTMGKGIAVQVSSPVNSRDPYCFGLTRLPS